MICFWQATRGFQPWKSGLWSTKYAIVISVPQLNATIGSQNVLPLVWPRCNLHGLILKAYLIHAYPAVNPRNVYYYFYYRLEWHLRKQFDVHKSG
jgi:hypothetical protein